MPSSQSTDVTLYEVYKTKKVWTTVYQILQEILEENKSQKHPKEILERQKRLSFHSKTPASVTLAEYIERILKYTHIEESTLIIALIYIDRLCDRQNVILSENNIHRIVLAAIILATKYNEDDFYSNNYYSKVGGISVQELNILEYEFSKLVKYSLFIREDIYEKYNIYLAQYRLRD
jgi:hypothetical protein